jgi:predicted HTH transcriptional regulator
MKPASTPIAERMVRYAWRIYCGGEVTTAWMRERFGLSKMTAKRDMDLLLKALPVRQDAPTRRGVLRRVSMARVVVRGLQ